MSNTKEIGGYFGLESFSGKEYYSALIPVNSGRNALLYIIKAQNIKKLYIPSFLCDTVYRLCEREGCRYEFYSIDKNFRPVFDKELKSGEWLYIVNYYGQISDEEIVRYKDRYGRVIFDNVQAFFQKPQKGIDTVYSCRKFFGVPDGGYVYTEAPFAEELKTDFSADRMKHILGRYERTGSEFYSDFQSNDEDFYNLELREMSCLTKNILKAVDYEAVRKKRNDNFAFLQNALGNYNKLEITAPDGVYCYPFYCENGMGIKKALAQKKIYVPTLWPNVLEQGNELERDYAENILPLPCDQRYELNDMQKILDELKNINNLFGGKLNG